MVPTFEPWVKAVFDHPVPFDFYQVEESIPRLAPAVATAYYTELFENSEQVLAPYSDEQINQSLWALEMDGDLQVIVHPDVPLTERLRCAESIYLLFAQCFAARCTPHLSHRDEPGAGALNSICYMWWDNFPLMGAPDNPAYREIDARLLDVMRRTLTLDSIACQESALHGLGHWHLAYPKETEKIIDNFLSEAAGLRPELVAYAQAARLGCVQ